MGKTYNSGTKTTGEKRSPLAPSSTAPGFTTMGVSAPSGSPEHGTLRRKGGAPTGDLSGRKANRGQQFERNGAQFRIQVPRFAPQAPEAAATQANGRIVPSYAKMQDRWSGDNFWGGTQSGG